MAEVIHRYVGRGDKVPKMSSEERKRQAAQHKADAELVRERSEAIRVKRMGNQLLLAKARGELIPKALAQQQAGFLLITLRSKILAIPQTYSRRLLDISDREVIAGKLKEMAISVLHEIENLPHCAEPGWVNRNEETPSSKKKK